MDRDKLDKMVAEAAVERDGVKRLACAVAFELAGNHAVTLMDIGGSCNRQGIKIVRCQLGCF